ncbi:hypothetical protein [Flavihumibacter solisilvae]|jgi:hypothetical protein|uniref:Uncharacterized protein n=1 Tax=Flavihumibacter solisilvae TaxID=1349421 RepID=A0A0C1IPX7_9BACT|nr:hypothetical protein [Flavihumibacter solisilvae]KIC96290.1 hypothetical protein OI18_00560 [Flavihumibacter solisilvae]
MKAATVQEIKEALNHLPPGQVADLCLRLVKFKKDNKELVTYLLFESGQAADYLEAVKKEIRQDFSLINSSQLYFAKKSLRRILRNISKQVKYISSKESEAELLLTFCISLKESGIPYKNSQALVNLFQAQLKKIRKLQEGFHEDLQYDISRELKKLGE